MRIETLRARRGGTQSGTFTTFYIAHKNTHMVELSPLSPSFVARLTGVDLTQEIDDDSWHVVEAAHHRHPVLVLPDQTISDDQQVAFSERFGVLETTKPGTVGSGSKVVVLTNLDHAGNIVATSHRQILNGRANQQWHTDSSFKVIAAKASLLSARIVPQSGGQTEFICMRTVYAALPEALRQQVEGQVAIHDYAYGRGQIDPNLVTGEEREALPPVEQAMVINHGEGVKSLYIGAHCKAIKGLTWEQSRQLIDKLTAFATQEQFVYRHDWQADDLVIWNNRATLHRGVPFRSAEARRLMVRTTVAGDMSTLAAAG